MLDDKIERSKWANSKLIEALEKIPQPNESTNTPSAMAGLYFWEKNLLHDNYQREKIEPLAC